MAHICRSVDIKRKHSPDLQQLLWPVDFFIKLSFPSLLNLFLAGIVCYTKHIWFGFWDEFTMLFESCQPSKVPTALSTQPIISEILTRVFPGPRLSYDPLGLLMQLASSASVDGRAAL